MHMEHLQLVDIHVEKASRPFREEVASLKLLLAHTCDSLEPACTSVVLGLAPSRASLLLDSIEQKSSTVEEDHL
jgi:hypothetical protein